MKKYSKGIRQKMYAHTFQRNSVELVYNFMKVFSLSDVDDYNSDTSGSILISVMKTDYITVIFCSLIYNIKSLKNMT